jgi:asparagine synthase (glutamine-hydrolysing)
MSGIAGIFNLDGRPVDPALLGRLTGVIAHRGPDAEGHWVSGPVGLGHRMLQTTPESLHERQPLSDETGHLCLVLDGRVDNREELREGLEARGARLRDDTDAELVLWSYQIWGEECPANIIGDFAFAIWDGRKRQLFCARDFLGLKSFYYYSDSRTFIFGSELHQLFEDERTPREPNEGMIGEYLACNLVNNEETLYKNIYRLPASHSLVIQSAKVYQERYWDVDPKKSVRYRRDEEYAAQFLSLFKETVRCRLRSNGPVGVELSGGLDSSSVVGLVHLLNREEGLAENFESFSMFFPGLVCDESQYIQEAVQRWNLKSNVLNAGKLKATDFTDEVSRYKDFPQYPNGVLFYPLLSLAREKGIRVMLNGGGGDDCLTGSFYHYADLLRRFRLGRFFRQVYHDQQFNKDSGVPAVIFPSRAVLRVGLWPLVPRYMRRFIDRLLKRDKAPEWIDTRFARRIHLTERTGRRYLIRRFPSFAQEDIYKNITSGWMYQSTDLGNRCESWFGLENRSPFLDRRLVELALALPEEQRWRMGQTKYILRQAMKGILPESIRLRTTKADFSYIFAEVFKLFEEGRLFDSSAIESMGWIDVNRVNQIKKMTLEAYTESDTAYISHTWKLWMILGIELWLNAVFAKRGFHQQESLAFTKLAIN